jgi:hypothetical protein
MAERSKGFKIGAVCLFVGAIALLSYVLVSNSSDGPAVVAVEPVAAETPPTPEAPQPTVVNAQVTEEATPPTETPPDEVAAERLTPENVKKAMSIMN